MHSESTTCFSNYDKSHKHQHAVGSICLNINRSREHLTATSALLISSSRRRSVAAHPLTIHACAASSSAPRISLPTNLPTNFIKALRSSSASWLPARDSPTCGGLGFTHSRGLPVPALWQFSSRLGAKTRLAPVVAHQFALLSREPRPFVFVVSPSAPRCRAHRRARAFSA